MKFNIEVTLSKILAYIVVFLGTYVSIKLNTHLCWEISVAGAVSLIMNKQYQDRKKVPDGAT